jgi:hypothetical protein
MPGPASTRHAKFVHVSQMCAAFGFRHANLRTTNIRVAITRGVNVLQQPDKPYCWRKTGIALVHYEPAGANSPHRCLIYLKGQCHEIFDLWFFPNQPHLGP